MGKNLSSLYPLCKNIPAPVKEELIGYPHLK